MTQVLPQFIDTAARVVAAHEALAAAHARREEAVQAVRDIRNKASRAESKLATEAQALADAQSALGTALMADVPVAAIQSQVNSHKNSVDSLKIVVAQLTAEANALDAGLAHQTGPINDADAQLAAAEFDHLIAQYAKIIAPAIPLALEIHEKAKRLNAGLNGSGLLLDPRSARIGRYRVDANGNLYVSAS